MTTLPKRPAAAGDATGRRAMLDTVPHWPDWLLIVAVGAADEAGDDGLLAAAAAELASRLDGRVPPA